MACDASFTAAEANIHYRALPRHPGGQRLHFFQSDVGMVADSAFGRSARRVVLDAKSLEAPDAPVVHANGQGDSKDALGVLDHFPNIAFEFQRIRSQIEVFKRELVR